MIALWSAIWNGNADRGMSELMMKWRIAVKKKESLDPLSQTAGALFLFCSL